MAHRLSSRMLFCDWHMPNFLPQVTIDLDEYFAQIARTGAQTLIFQAKTAHGGSLFPTEVGITNPAMTGDIFGEVCRRAKAMGLEFIAYYNMVLSWDLGRLHPQWSQRGRDGEPLRMFLYPCQCMSNDDFADYVAEHMAEATRKYPIDGWFLDLQYFSPEGCYCPACRHKFAERFGYELAPEQFGVEQWLDFYAYQAQRREWFIHHAMERCNAERPGLSWSWNGCGNPVAISPTLHEGAHYLSTEAHPPGYLHADHTTRFCEGLGLPFTLFMPESQGSWGDWTVTTAETIKGLSAIALAHGGSLNINHVPYPCGDYAGKVPQIVWDTITEVFAWVTQREELCRDRRPVPVVAVLHSADNNRLLQALARTPEHAHLGHEAYANEQALAQLLMETHTPWEIRPEDVSLQELQRYELVILPFVPHVSEQLAEKLRTYVHGGGCLLATWQTSLFGPRGARLDNFTLADLFGVDLVADSPYSVCYLDALDAVFEATVPRMPLLIKDSASGALNPRNHALYVRPREGTRTLATLMDPIIESDFEAGYYVYHDHAPPGSRTEYPAITVSEVGAGRVVYLPVPFLKGYAAKASPFLREAFRVLLTEVLGVPTRIRIEAPVSVKHALMEDAEGWLLHLIHVQKQTDAMYLDSFHRADPITLRLRPGWPVAGAEEALSGRPLECRQVHGWTEVSVPGVTDHSIVRVRRG
ncbi:MAG: beta-galactosidase trimerization domain-containing protein [Armatimonadota bacterium]